MKMHVMWLEIRRIYLYYFLLCRHRGLNNTLLHFLSPIGTFLFLSSKIDFNVFTYLSRQEIDNLLSICLHR